MARISISPSSLRAWVKTFIPDEDFKDIYYSAIVTNKNRNEKIRDIALKECERGTVIVVCKQLEQGKNSI
jgi:hypothetical protein